MGKSRGRRHFDLDPSDFHGHGTSVSGVIGAQIDNETGVSGVCPNCKILPLKVLASRYITRENGDTIIQSRYINSNLADGIIYGVDEGADILNMSLGGSDFDTLGVLYQAIKYAHQNGVIMIAGAGNDNSEEEFYPAAYEEIISVAGTDESDRRSSFSNFGDWVDVSAPGSRIVTTAPFLEGYPLWLFSSLLLPSSDLLFDPSHFDFSGFTQNGPINAPISFIGRAREEDVLNDSLDWELTGKIALIERGDITFKEKVDRANAFGAVGVIIYNNSPGRFSGNLIEPQENPIPAITLSQEEGQSLLQAWRQDTSLKLRLSVEEIAGYTEINGTSFSSPYVAGMAGLILSQWPESTPEEVRNRIRNSVDNIDFQNPEYIGKLGTGRVSLSKLFENQITSQTSPIERIGLSVAPNPVKNILTLSSSNDNFLSQLRIVNLMGQEVYRQQDPTALSKPYFEIDLSDLPPGNYFIWGDSPIGSGFKQIVKLRL